jgi:hypothetical protein
LSEELFWYATLALMVLAFSLGGCDEAADEAPNSLHPSKICTSAISGGDHYSGCIQWELRCPAGLELSYNVMLGVYCGEPKKK